VTLPRTARSRALARRARERKIVEATRALFDERGRQDAPVDEIARAVGINKALIYRHFSSKEELFVLTVTDYLADLRGRTGAEVDPATEPVAALRETCEQYTAFCAEYPAFLDCALSLMRRPAHDLRERISEAVWLRLGRSMADALAPLSRILAAGADAGVFGIEDPDLAANRLYAQVLGTMHLARTGVGVRRAAPGIPEAFPIDPDEVRRACVDDALALARTRPPHRGH
jgi:AcrR family transcriptional regulator